LFLEKEIQISLDQEVWYLDGLLQYQRLNVILEEKDTLGSRMFFDPSIPPHIFFSSFTTLPNDFSSFNSIISKLSFSILFNLS